MKRYSLQDIEATFPQAVRQEAGSARERMYLIARIGELMEALDRSNQAIANLMRDVAFEKAVNERVGEVVTRMFKDIRDGDTKS